jgi:uncharacterized membrane protein
MNFNIYEEKEGNHHHHHHRLSFKVQKSLISQSLLLMLLVVSYIYILKLLSDCLYHSFIMCVCVSWLQYATVSRAATT